jgi:hypothetical protein
MQSQPSTRSGAPTRSFTSAKVRERFSTRSTPLATVSTMPSSMAQKKVRLPSGFTFWIERTYSSPPSLTTTGCEAKIMGDSSSTFSPTRRANSRPAGSPLISVTMRLPGSAQVTTICSSLLTKCCVLNTQNGCVVWTRATTARSRANLPSW